MAKRAERRRLHSALLDSVALLREQLDLERRQPPERRPTAATTPTVLDAVERAEAAWQRLSWGDDVAAALELRGMVVAAQGWQADADLTRLVRETGGTAERLLDRHPDDPRLRPPPAPAAPDPRDPRLEATPPPTSEFLLPDALDLPTVVGLLRAGDTPGAVRDYRARTGVGLRDAHTAINYAVRRLGYAGDS